MSQEINTETGVTGLESDTGGRDPKSRRTIRFSGSNQQKLVSIEKGRLTGKLSIRVVGGSGQGHVLGTEIIC